MTEVLNHKQVVDRIQRIAWQIFENNQDSKRLYIAGIADQGYLLAQKIADKVNEISDLNVELLKLKIYKKNPRETKATLDKENIDLNDASVVLVDDVLNSGSTLIYGVNYFLDFALGQISTVVLVDRNHKKYPVKADFKGLSLSTSSMEHVEVILDKAPYSVVLS